VEDLLEPQFPVTSLAPAVCTLFLLEAPPAWLLAIGQHMAIQGCSACTEPEPRSGAKPCLNDIHVKSRSRKKRRARKRARHGRKKVISNL
jgi:hypothetical protein